MDSYLVTPNGSLQKYNHKSGKIIIISNDMPSDSFDPTRMNTIGINENNKIDFLQILKSISNIRDGISYNNILR